MTARIQAVLFLLLMALSWTTAVAQDRLTRPIDNSEIVALKGSVSPQARPQNDLGPLDPSMSLPHVTLTLKPSPAQEAARKQLLADQQNPNSPDYHKWLTPEQHGERFGLSGHDIDTISRWLTSQGFQVVEVARARNWIAFNGTVNQVELAFHTQLHRFTVDSEDRFSNTVDPSIPRALNGVVLGLRGLNNFKAKSLRVEKSKSLKGNYSDGFGNSYLAPDDIATIYDIGPLYAAGIDGTGMKIAIMGQTDVHMTDIEQFRTGFNLPANDPTVVLASGCTDPGFRPDEGEADLDLEWSGAVARQATVIFVTCDTSTHRGVFDSLMYTIANDVAPVISMSYGLCEAMLGSSFAPQYESILQQANAQGQTLLVSSGDNNAAGCDNQSSASVATNGLGVNGLASPEAATAVGGTEFDADVQDPGTYWDSVNTASGRSAKQYIGELAWNDGDLGTTLSGGLWGTGGGASIFFTKPTWQTGAGVPNDGARDVPDVAMTASGDHDGYVYCTTASCAGGIANAVSNGSIVGGTSAAAPVFAGVITLLNHYLSKSGTPPGLGNINPQLYSMAASTPAAFHDIPAGDFSMSNTPSGNMVNCQSGTANCPAAPPFQFGFLTTAGYDQATGLGSVDANVFVTHWGGNSGLTPTTATLTVSPSNVTEGASVTFTATVSPAPPNGETITVTDTNTNSNLGTAPIASGVATFTTSSLASGSYSVVAKYAGDSTLAASTSTASALTVQKSSTTTTTTLSVSQGTVKVGDSVTLTATITPAPPNGETVTFTNGVSGTTIGSGTTSSGTAVFASTSIPGGTYNVVASYPGDKSMAASASATSTLNIEDFSLSPSTLNISISAPGQSGSGTLTFGLVGGLNQAPTFACSGLPAESTCSFTSASATSETVTIATTAASSMRSSLLGKGTGTLYALLLPGFLGLVLPAANRKRALGSVLPVLMMLVLLTLWLPACGGSGNGGTGAGTHDTGTPVGQKNVTVTATESGVTHTVTINLNVQ
jgi:subtilase family serine protease